MIPYAGIALAALLILSGTYMKGYSNGKRHEQDQHAIAIAKATQDARDKEDQDRAERDQRDTSYLGRIRELEALVAAPVQPQPIRLCRPSGGSSGGAAQPAALPDAASPSGEPVLQAGPDIGSQLVQYGRVCESLRIQLDELQGWVTSTR